MYIDDVLMEEEAELEQSIILFPSTDTSENRNEQHEKQQHRQRHRQRAAAPQTARFSRQDEHQGKHEEDSESVSGPPRNPTRRQIGPLHLTEGRQATQRQSRAGQAKNRGEQQEARQVATVVE